MCTSTSDEQAGVEDVGLIRTNVLRVEGGGNGMQIVLWMNWLGCMGSVLAARSELDDRGDEIGVADGDENDDENE